jgi:hypothetical protein
MQVSLTLEAKAELAAARDWYDEQRPGLGAHLMAEYLP